MVKIDIEDNVKKEELDLIKEEFSFSSFFNSIDWLDTLTSSFGSFSSFWITARKGSVLEGAMPVVRVNRKPFFRLRSLPFATYGTPLARSPGNREKMIRKFLVLSSERFCIDSIAVIYDPEWREWAPAGLPSATTESRIIKLEEDFDYYRSRMMNSTRRKVCRRSRKAGVEIRPLDNPEELSSFYRIYRERSSAWGGVHPIPEIFFRNLFGLRGERIIFSGAFLDGRLLGCHIDFYSGNMGQAWIAGVSEEGNRLGAPSYLIYHSVRKAYEKGIGYFNLGSSGGDEGLIFFKESLGGQRRDYLTVSTEKRWCSWIRKVQGG